MLGAWRDRAVPQVSGRLLQSPDGGLVPLDPDPGFVGNMQSAPRYRKGLGENWISPVYTPPIRIRSGIT
jgi:hypothetical protein